MKKYDPVYGFDSRLEKAIFDSGLEIGVICKQSGISRSLVWAYLYRGTTPSANNIVKLALTLKVSTDYLLGIKNAT